MWQYKYSYKFTHFCNLTSFWLVSFVRCNNINIRTSSHIFVPSWVLVVVSKKDWDFFFRVSGLWNHKNCLLSFIILMWSFLILVFVCANMSLWINLELYLFFIHCWYFSFSSSDEFIISIIFLLIISSSLIEADFLDVTFNLIEGAFRPYKKRNSNLSYINISSNHPPNIIKPLSIQ